MNIDINSWKSMTKNYLVWKYKNVKGVRVLEELLKSRRKTRNAKTQIAILSVAPANLCLICRRHVRA